MRIDKSCRLEGDHSRLTRTALCAGIAVLALSAGYMTDPAAPVAAQFASAAVRPIVLKPAAQPSVAMHAVQLDAVQPADDATVTLKITTALLEAPGVKGLNVDVETVNGVVTLKGMVNSFAQAVSVIRIARATEGVKHVDNRLALRNS